MTNETKREAFVAVITDNAFGIGLAQENERGYYPMRGHGVFDSYEKAAAKARELNERIGLDATDAAMIVCSSMRAQNQENE